MKSLASKITEARSQTAWHAGVEGSETTDKADVLAVDIKSPDMKKYGFLSWDNTTGCAFIITFDSVEDYAAAYGTDTEGIQNLENIKVGSVVDCGSLYLRIW